MHLLGRMPVVHVAHVRRDHAHPDRHVTAPLEPLRPDDDRVGVPVVEYRAVRRGARAPDPPELGLERRERLGRRAGLRRRPGVFERMYEIAVRRRWCAPGLRAGAGRTSRRIEDACGGVRRRSPAVTRAAYAPRGCPAPLRGSGQAPRNGSLQIRLARIPARLYRPAPGTPRAEGRLHSANDVSLRGTDRPVRSPRPAATQN